MRKLKVYGANLDGTHRVIMAFVRIGTEIDWSALPGRRDKRGATSG